MTEQKAPTLTWAPAALEELWAEVEECAPREAVGAMLGKGSHVFAVVPLHNIEPSEDHYAVTPEELVGLYVHVDETLEGALDVLGFWHSHPRTSAEPSVLDRATAVPGLLYVVASLRDREILEFFGE